MISDGRQRIDKWLFFARAVKSRSLAAKLVTAGRVRLNRDKASQASDPVKVGDVLTITLERRILVWKVLAPGARRGPPAEARSLYEDMSPPPAARDPALPDALVPLRKAGSGRPTKKDRREIERLSGDD
jgi:ribosome-associated heat shock protein Hsp15